MKVLREPKNLPFLIFGTGLAGMLLRIALYKVGADARGLIANYHPLQAVCLLLIAAIAVYTAVTLKKDGSSNDSEAHFPANRNALIFTVLVPIWFLVNAFASIETANDRFDVTRAVLAFVTVPCFAWTGYRLFRGKQSSFVPHGIICLFFAVDMICRYRIWSGNPQLADYIFHLFACVFLTLTAYHRAAFDAGLGKPRMFRFCSLMAALFCMLALVGPDNIQFYIGGFLWAVSGICPPAPEKSAENAEEI